MVDYEKGIKVEVKFMEEEKKCGKCKRLAKIPGHPSKGYCIWLDCLVKLDDTLRNKRVGCFVTIPKGW